MNVIQHFGKGLKKFKNFLFRNNPNTPVNSKEGLNISNLNNLNNLNSINDPHKNFSNNSSESINKIIPGISIIKDIKNNEEISKINSYIIENSNEMKNKYSNMILFETRARLASSKNKNKISEKNNTKQLQRNQLKNRVCTLSVQANNPIEDAFNAIQLKNINGFFLSVLDGHGGNHISEYANRELHRKFDDTFYDLKNLNDFTLDEKITLSFNNAFEVIVK